MAVPTSYVRISINLVGGVVDTTYSLYRSTVSADGPFQTIGQNLPLLGERAVFIDDTAPIGQTLYYRRIGDQSGDVHDIVNVMLPVQGLVWLKDPLRPWADIALDFCDQTIGHVASGCVLIDPEYVWGGFGEQDWDSDTGLFPILNAEHPADVFARRKFAEGSFTFFTRTLDNIDRVYDLFTAGGPLFLQLPDEYGWHDHFIQPGTVTMDYIARDQRRPERVWRVPFVIVDQPGGPTQGTACNNWCIVNDSFATYADMTATGDDWLTLLLGETLCPPGFEDGFGIGPFGDGPFGDGG